jgi:hypothetical protein
MGLEYDKIKNTLNLAKHGLSFEKVAELDWTNSITRADDRFDYGEFRSITYGMIDNRLYILIWTIRNEKIRPISFRKANKRERNFYAKKKST